MLQMGQKQSSIGEPVDSETFLSEIRFRCFTSGKPSNQFPDEAALKIYFDGQGKNFTDLGNIDKELTEQGVRYPVYAWVEKGQLCKSCFEIMARHGVYANMIFVAKKRMAITQSSSNFWVITKIFQNFPVGFLIPLLETK